MSAGPSRKTVAVKAQDELEDDKTPKAGSPSAKRAFLRAQTQGVGGVAAPKRPEEAVPSTRPATPENNRGSPISPSALRPASAEKGKGKGFGPSPTVAPSERNKPSFGPSASERDAAAKTETKAAFGPTATQAPNRAKAAFGKEASERKHGGGESIGFGPKRTYGRARTVAGNRKGGSDPFSSPRKAAPRQTSTMPLEETEELGGEAAKGEGGNGGGGHSPPPRQTAFGKTPTLTHVAEEQPAVRRKTQTQAKIEAPHQVNAKEKIDFGQAAQTHSKYSFLESHPFFMNTHKPFKADVCRSIVPVSVKHDALMLEERVPVLDMKGGYVYLVDTHDTGACFEMSLERQRIGTLSAGSAFGDAVAVGVVSTHVFSVRCNRQDHKVTNLWGIPIAKLSWALKKHPNDEAILRQRALDIHARFLRLRALNSYEPQLVFGFESVPLEFHTRIFQHSQIWLHRPGVPILKEGDREDEAHAFMIWKGKVSCDVGGEVVTDLSTEVWHGLTELLEVTPTRAYTTTTRVDCVCVKVEKKLFLSLMEDFSEETPLLNEIMFNTLDHLSPFSFRLDQLAMFSDCSQGVLLHLMAGAERKCFERGEKILHSGDENEDMYVVCRGTLAVQTEDGIRAQTLKCGDAYGDLAVLGIAQSKSVSQCLISVTISEVKVLTRAFFMSVIEANPGDRETFLQMHAAHGDDAKIAEEAIFDLPLFSCVDGECLHELMNLTTDLVSFPGTFLYRANEEGHSMFIIVRGVVEIFSPSLNTRFEMQGPNCIGEYALSSEEDGWRRTATVQAGTVCDLKELTREDFLTTMDKYPGQRERFNEHVMNQLQQLQASASDKASVSLEKCTATARNQRKLRPAGTFIQRDGQGQSASNTLFSKCSQDFLKEITMGIEKKMYYPGQEIIKEGDVGEYGIIIQVGQAVVEAQGTKVGELGPGSFVGEMAVLGFAERRVATVRATTLVLGLILYRDVIVNALESFPDQVKRFAEMADSRGQVLHAMVESDVEIKTGIELADRVSRFRRYAQFLKKATMKTIYDPDAGKQDKCTEAHLNAYSRKKIKYWLRRRMDQLEDAELRRDVRLVHNGKMVDPVPPDRGCLPHDAGDYATDHYYGDVHTHQYYGGVHTHQYGAFKDLDRATRVYTHRPQSAPSGIRRSSNLRPGSANGRPTVMPMDNGRISNRLITRVGGRLRGTAAIEYSAF